MPLIKDIDEREMPLLDHLVELRNRLMYSAAAVLIGFLVCYLFAAHIYEFLVRPLAKMGSVGWSRATAAMPAAYRGRRGARDAASRCRSSRATVIDARGKRSLWARAQPSARTLARPASRSGTTQRNTTKRNARFRSRMDPLRLACLETRAARAR